MNKLFRCLLIAWIIFCMIAYFPIKSVTNSLKEIREQPVKISVEDTNWFELILGECLPGYEAECRSVEANPWPSIGYATILFILAVIILYYLFWMIGATLQRMDTPR